MITCRSPIQAFATGMMLSQMANSVLEATGFEAVQETNRTVEKSLECVTKIATSLAKSATDIKNHVALVTRLAAKDAANEEKSKAKEIAKKVGDAAKQRAANFVLDQREHSVQHVPMDKFQTPIMHHGAEGMLEKKNAVGP